MKKVGMGLLISFVVFGMTGCGCAKKEAVQETEENDKIYANTNEGIIKDQELGSLIFTNTSLVINDGLSKLTTVVTNTSEEDVLVDLFDITLKDQDGNVIAVLVGDPLGVVPALESRTIVSECSIDLSHATTLEYSIHNM